MEPRLTVLKLALDALGVPIDIETVDDRKRIQKAIYLGQLGGFDLGYRFGWYKKGPYSPSLTRDYFALVHALATEEGHEDRRLVRSYERALKSTAPLLVKPANVELPEEDWLELVASLDYLMRVRRLPYRTAVRELGRTKAALVPFASAAHRHLQETGFASDGAHKAAG